MTITATTPRSATRRVSEVYLPQEDSHLLISALEQNLEVAGRSVLDLCTGTGVVAIAAARLGASSTTAWDICPRAVQCSRENVAAAGVAVEIRHGSWAQAPGSQRFDVVLANPPYVPVGPQSSTVDGPTWAWDAGPDGRLVIDPLCATAPSLLNRGGSLLFVQSEFSGTEESLATLSAAGLVPTVVARQRIPFGPVMTSRAEWLERSGRLPVGCREEELVVIRADRR